MRTIDPKTVVEKYDEISHLETRSERIEFLTKPLCTGSAEV